MDERAAMTRWAPLAYSIGNRYYLPGSDRDDVSQEALIGLLKGLRSYDGRGHLSAFLGLAISRHLAAMLRAALREKHGPLNNAARGHTLEDVGGGVDPHDRLMCRETRSALGALSLVERRAVVGLACGLTHADLGGKAADNAAYRGRRRLRALLAGGEAA